MLVFDELGWDLIHAENETDGDPSLLGREHQGEVVLKKYLFPALQKLNPDLPDEALNQTVENLLSHIRRMALRCSDRCFRDDRTAYRGGSARRL